jgi:hypothetical protein
MIKQAKPNYAASQKRKTSQEVGQRSADEEPGNECSTAIKTQGTPLKAFNTPDFIRGKANKIKTSN